MQLENIGNNKLNKRKKFGIQKDEIREI